MLAHFLSQLKKLSSSSTDHHYYTVTRISILSMQKINWEEHKQLWEWKEYKKGVDIDFTHDIHLWKVS